jgi:hypothetical protein
MLKSNFQTMCTISKCGSKDILITSHLQKPVLPKFTIKVDVGHNDMGVTCDILPSADLEGDKGLGKLSDASSLQLLPNSHFP